MADPNWTNAIRGLSASLSGGSQSHWMLTDPVET